MTTKPFSIDAEAHFSVWDAARGSGRPVFAFDHGQADSLARSLRANLKPGQRPLLLSDGVFPISGEIAPVPDYLTVLQDYAGALLVLDDAHATGVIGEKGQGTLEYYGLQGERCYTAHTMSKALASCGGLIADGSELIDKLEANSKIWVATSPPPLPLSRRRCLRFRLASR